MIRNVRTLTLWYVPLLAVVACTGETRNEEAAAGGGAVVVVDDGQACPDCRILMEEVATLGDPDDPASIRLDAIREGCRVGRLSTGEYLVSAVVGGGEIFVYDGNGPAVRLIGQRGRGPGEFGRNLQLVVTPGDTVHVVDNSNYRITSFDAKGDFLGSFQLPGRTHSFARLESGDFLLHTRPTGTVQDHRAIFHLLAPGGELRASFGEPTRDLVEFDLWIVSPGSQGTFWTASSWEYQLYQWHAPDSLRSTVVREAAWFPRGQVWSEDTWTRVPPPTFLTHIYEAQDGLVWTYTTVPDLDWQPGPAGPTSPEWTRVVYDMIVEVLDLEAGSVVARLRLDEVLGAVCGAPYMYSVIETTEGDTRIKVFLPRLQR